MLVMKRCAIWFGPGQRQPRCPPRPASTSTLLRHGKLYSGLRRWTQAYPRWFTTVRFDHRAQLIVFEDYIHAVTDAERRIDRLTRQVEALLPDWSMAPVVRAIQAMRGVALINAVTVVVEVGDFARFGNPRQLMAYLVLVPCEHSEWRPVGARRHYQGR
jgi:transposase